MATTPVVTRRDSFKQVRTLSTSELIQLKTVGCVIVPAPGANKILLVHDVVVESRFNSAAFYSLVTSMYAYIGDPDTPSANSPTMCTVPSDYLMSSVNEVAAPQNSFKRGFGFNKSGNNTKYATSAELENKPLVLAAVADIVDNGSGAINVHRLNTAGTGYAVGDTGRIVGSATAGESATYVVDEVSEAGGVVAYTITSNGSGHAYGLNAATATAGLQPGIGTNFTIDVLSVTPVDEQLQVTTYFSEVTLVH
jgi:hypothetical protein